MQGEGRVSWSKPIHTTRNQSLATSAHEFNSPRTGFQRTFRQHFVHSDLLPPDAKDPSDVATAQA